MLGLGLSIPAVAARSKGVGWWRAAAHLLDGVAPGFFLDVVGQEVASVADVPSMVVVNDLRIDVLPIGPLAHDTGTVDQDGAPVVEPVAGWHVNLLMPDDGVLPDPLLAVQVFPVTPSFVFAAPTP